MIRLDNITLMSIIGSESYLDNTIKAIRYSCKNIEFEKVKLLSNKYIKLDDIEVIEIEPLDKEKYAEFCIYDLPNYIDTDFCLTVQYDGFVINHNLWKEEFLSFDYIGAPWLSEPRNNVGNGGFSLRSKKFLQAARTLEYNSKLKFQPYIPAGELITPEDWFVCNYSYQKMLDMNVKFADIKTAYSFSVEHPSNIKNYDRANINTYNSFGFHGNFNTGAMKLLEIQ